MIKPITPTVGRNVWLFGNVYGAESLSAKQPFHVNVVFVHSDNSINVAGYDHTGNPFKIQGVTLRQPGEPQPPLPIWAEWMPYQTGQAQKEANQPYTHGKDILRGAEYDEEKKS
jgi:hypothetical protein